MKDRILIVEDEADIAALIKVHLTELALECDICSQGTHALDLALTNTYQLVLLDVMLPGLSGLDICRQLRQEKPLQAIIMLTSKTSETDRVLGLELGADDYMTKPFSVRELQARVRAQLRRVHALNLQRNNTESSLNVNNSIHSSDNNSTLTKSNEILSQHVNATTPLTTKSVEKKTEQQIHINAQNSDDCTSIGNLLVNHRYHQVTYQNSIIKLTATEFDLIDFFCRHPDQVFSRAQLLDNVWGYHHSGYEHTVNSHINRLRNKLEEDCNDPQIIQTVWGVGYKLNSIAVCKSSLKGMNTELGL
jgi:DNA-binding response OmpR family regulator